MLSVGIDIGTTTTQLVFSDLTLASAARAGQVPRLAITGRSVRYASPILATPLLDAETLDPPFKSARAFALLGPTEEAG